MLDLHCSEFKFYLQLDPDINFQLVFPCDSSYSKTSFQMELRISVNAVTTFLLMNFLLSGTTFADRLKTSFTDGVRRAPGTQRQPARICWTPTQYMQLPVQKESPNELLSQETSRSVQSISAKCKAENHFACTPKGVADLMSPRRELRDISPPGLWPPGSDAPPSESLFELTRRRALLSAAGDYSKRMESRAAPTRKLSPPLKSPPGTSPWSDSPLELPAADRREEKLLSKPAAGAVQSRKSQLRHTSSPGLWHVTDSQPSELASKRVSVAAPQVREGSVEFRSFDTAYRLKPFSSDDFADWCLAVQGEGLSKQCSET